MTTQEASVGLTRSQHDELVLGLYDHASAASLDAMLEPWPRAFRSTGLHSFLLDSRGSIVESSVVAIDGPTGAPEEYEGHWRAVDPRLALAAARPGQLFSDVDHIEPRSFEQSDLYHAVLRPFDLRYTLFGSIQLAGGHVFAPAAMRSRRAGAYSHEEVAAMERLLPHLSRALHLRLELAALRAHAADLTTALDHSRTPVVLLDAAGCILHLTAAANAVLATRDTLEVRTRRLVARHPSTAAKLRAAVDQALRFADLPSSSREKAEAPATVVDIPRERGPSLTVIVHPLRPRPTMTGSEGRARALVILHDPGSRLHVDRALLRQIYSLTATEAELAGAIAEGAALADFAAARGCSEATARTHLKRIFEKTRTSRQAELVHAILASAALHLVGT